MMRGRDVLIHIALLPVTLAVAGTLIGLVWSIVRAGSRPGWLGTRRPMLDGFNEGWIDFGGGRLRSRTGRIRSTPSSRTSPRS